jgi:large subunit ribosomal protein L9
MKVILTETIEKVGSKGDVINVKRGYARNFLIPRNYAMYATPQNMKSLETLKKQFADEESKRLEQLKQVAQQISGLKLDYVRKTDEHDNMYGSVSENDILHSLMEKGIEIAKTALVMDKHIKQLGDFEIPVRLHKDIQAVLHGTVRKEGADKEADTTQASAEAKEETPVAEPEVIQEDSTDIPEEQTEDKVSE